MTTDERPLATTDWARVPATGQWSVLVAPGFATVDNGDGVQAHLGDRVLYVSSISVTDPSGSPEPAKELCATAGRRLAQLGAPRLALESGASVGGAEISSERGDGSYDTFLTWFEVEHNSVVEDLVDGDPLKDDELWQALRVDERAFTAQARRSADCDVRNQPAAASRRLR